jgi:CRP-like cAMP-binding protein
MIEPRHLRPLALLDGLSDAQIGQLATAGESLSFGPGDELFQQSAPAEFWWLLLTGRIALHRRTGGDEKLVGTMSSPGQWAGGFWAWDQSGVYLATGRAVEAGHLLRVPADRLRALADSWFPFGVHFIRGLVQTVRNIESIARQQESLAALGTLAAGLAHELNNPASAATRAVDALVTTSDACSTRSVGWHRRRSRPSSSSRSTRFASSGRRSGRRPLPSSWPIGRTSSATGCPTTASTGTG